MGEILTTRSAPYEAEIEYLESTGTEYINTGYKSTGIGLEAYVRCARTTTSTAEVGIVATAAQHAFDIYATKNICIWNQGTNILNSNIQMTKDTVFDITGGMTNTGLTLTVDGKSFSRTATPSIIEASDILLFSYRYIYKFIGRIYRCKLYDNSTLVRDFIPVRVGQTGYMYDRVTKSLFENKGSGNFILGKDIHWTKTLNTRIKNRYDTEENWLTENPILLSGEPAFTTVNGEQKSKVGDGETPYANLPYINNMDEAMIIRKWRD